MNPISAWLGLLVLPREERRIRLRFLLRRAAVLRRMRQSTWGNGDRQCPICGYHGIFAPHGRPARLDAACPSCGSLERHRQIHLYCERIKPFSATDAVLHFAPEKHLTDYVTPRVARYETADLRDDSRLTHPRLNIEDTRLPDGVYDWILCNHVLEHVNDAKALAEFYRMLKPGGRALITVPVAEGMPKTYDGPTIVTKEARLLHYKQVDHVRFFGRDIRDRIRAAGSALSEFSAEWVDVVPFALAYNNTIFIATKPAA